MTKKEQVQLSDKEMDPVRRVAERFGLTEDEAATQLMQKEIARRAKRRTGKGPARVYPIKRRP